jgi:hypothetical protein
LKRFSILLIALLALVIAACTSEGAGTSASPSDAPATAESTPDATESESEDAEETVGAFPSFDLNGDPELASRFPDTVGGEALQVSSFRGDVFMSGGSSDPSFQEFLDSVGADLEDVSVAFGGAMSGDSPISVGAFRVLGASEDELEREFISASEESGDITGLEETSLGGKDVWSAADASGTGMSVFIYTKDDTLYFLTGTEEQVAEILAALP